MRTINQLALQLIENTPGLTATQIAHLIKKRGDSTSSNLNKLCMKGRLKRFAGKSWRYTDFNTWRYFPVNIAQ